MELNRKNTLVFLGVVCFSILFILVGNKINKAEVLESQEQECYKAKVLAINKVETQENELTESSKQKITTVNFKARITSGPNKGKIVEATQTIDSLYAVQYKQVKDGDKVIILYTPEAENTKSGYVFTEFNRSDILIWLVIAFLGLILIIGRGKGFLTIISLIFTILAVFAVYIPAILAGRNVYWTTIIVGTYIIFMSLLLLNGINKKTWCAILGNIGGLVVSGIIAAIMSGVLNITGVIDEDYVFIMAAKLKNPLDLVGLVWGGIVIGSLGAVMDVAMSISSAMNELSENMKEKTFSKMLKSGMNIGKDAIGTMTNTLILAYVGSALATVLLLVMYNKNILYLFNMEMIVVEVMQSIIGSAGILFAVPATALFASYMYTKIKPKYSYTYKDRRGEGIKSLKL